MTDTPNERSTTNETAKRGAVAPGGRRGDDLTLRDIWRMIRRARWIGAFAIMIGTAGGWIGGQALGPVGKRVTTVDGRVTTVDAEHSKEFAALRAADASLTDRINDLADQTKLTSYLICTFTRRNDPAAVPAECNQVILDWRRGVR
jgi:uncharacterized protein involved in exopolysaccharide biosynthesis